MCNEINISIIIVSYNTCALTAACVQSILFYETNVRYEIIIVDNNSSDNSVASLRNSFPSLNIIALERNVGFAAANNVGIKNACGEYLLFLNPDTLFLEPVLSAMIEFLENHDHATMVGCRILNPDGSFQRSFFPLTSLLYVFWISFFIERIVPITRVQNKWRIGTIQPGMATIVDRLLGAFMVIRRSSMDELGYFDESFFMYSEEEDLCFRIKKNGGKVWYNPKVSIIHYGGQSTHNDMYSSVVNANKSRFYFIRKHHKIGYRIIFSLFWMLGIIMRMILMKFSSSPGRGEYLSGYRRSIGIMWEMLFNSI
jgi:GT2 family glycosyltransferase